MNTCQEELQHHIAFGNEEQAIRQLLTWLGDCRQSQDSVEGEIDLLRSEVILHSGTLVETERDFSAHRIDSRDYKVSKARLRSALLKIIDELPRYPRFFRYLETVEEDRAWEAALQENSLEAYENYFNRYPKGKYILETERLMSELRGEIKRQALREKQRRDFFTRVSPLETPARDAGPATSSRRPDTGSELMHWWDGLPPAWRKALKNEIGHYGSAVGEKQLRRMLGLRLLDLSGNANIAELDPLRHLSTLQTLNLSHTGVSDLAPLATLTDLRTLDIQGTAVVTLRPLRELKQLERLVCSRGHLTDLRDWQLARPDCELVCR